MNALRLAKANTTIRLSREIGRGGEGTVFELDGTNDRVAKIYFTPPDETKTQKLHGMVQTASAGLLKVAAWPIDLLHDRSGRAMGFVMPRLVARRSVHELYSPKSRASAFPEADFRFVLHVCANIARAFAVVHSHGHVIGDVNHGNILVGPDGTVVLIDCDSFQVNDRRRVFTCDVGVPLFTPPELQGRAFRGLRREINHDLFGLSVLLFHLLFMGRHPFAGRYKGHGEMPIEKAIAEHRFAYGPDRDVHKMEIPAGALSLECLGDGVANLFVNAFTLQRVPPTRPDAQSWISCLEALKGELRQCSYAGWHHYPRSRQACPWCTMEQRTGVRLFGIRFAGVSARPISDVEGIWRSVLNAPDPGPEPPLPLRAVNLPGPSVSAATRFRRVASVSLVLLAVGVWAAVSGIAGLAPAAILLSLAAATWPRVDRLRRREADLALSAARTEWQSVLNSWTTQASRANYDAKLLALKDMKRRIDGISAERASALAKANAARRDAQLTKYLDRFRIDWASIQNIGPTRKAMLASYGVETAADIFPYKIYGIPGFGSALTQNLLEWRQLHEKNFRYNPNEPIDPKVLADLEAQFRQRQQNLIGDLRQGSSDLLRISQEITTARARLRPVLENAWNVLQSAEHNRRLY